MPHLSRLAEHAADTGRPFAVMVLDLDRFKAVNDTFGHAAGDAVLTEVARRLQDNLRTVDLVARIGGEEFLVAMPDTDLSEAQMAAERLCRIVARSPVIVPDGLAIEVTISIGLAMGGRREADLNRLIARADEALLGSKSGGRNQVMVSPLSAA